MQLAYLLQVQSEIDQETNVVMQILQLLSEVAGDVIPYYDTNGT